MGIDNMTNSQSQSSSQQQQSSNQTGGGPSSQEKQLPPQNQSKGPLEQLGESVNKMIGGGG